MDKIRLGGMALQNGILVHGPTSWAAAVRDDDGAIHVAWAPKRRLGASVDTPLLRGPLRLAEALAVLPDVRRRLPQARLPFERPAVAGAVIAGSLLAAAVRRSGGSPLARETVAALATLAPAAIALRGGELASYHGAEHISIGSYEQDGAAVAKEHERCGSHLIGPLLATTAVANALAGRAPRRTRRAARLLGAVGAVGVSVEIFGWMGRHPQSPIARALARPGYELQHRLSTAEPTSAQLQVADQALAACLAAEQRALAAA